jgi:hypothetical protein
MLVGIPIPQSRTGDDVHPAVFFFFFFSFRPGHSGAVVPQLTPETSVVVILTCIHDT